MTLGYSQQFPWEEPTLFKEKIQESKYVFFVDGKQYCYYGDENVQAVREPHFIPKIHTIREDEHDRWRPGMKIHHVYGNRTKKRECFLENECVSIQRIKIVHKENRISVLINGAAYASIPKTLGSVHYLDIQKMITLAQNDGFENPTAFFKWFNKDFSGKIIHWTQKVY
jgi:hypothetical protein